MNKLLLGLWVLGVMAVIAFWGTIFYVAWHFISKWW